MTSVPHESRHQSSLVKEEAHAWIAVILATIVWISVTVGFIIFDTTWRVAVLSGLVAAVVAYAAGERKLAIRADLIR